MRETQAASGYPVIDPNLRGADNDCVDLCERGVIEVTPERLEPVIAHPERCVGGCTLRLSGPDKRLQPERTLADLK